jgi:hypothetical protein
MRIGTIIIRIAFARDIEPDDFADKHALPRLDNCAASLCFCTLGAPDVVQKKFGHRSQRPPYAGNTEPGIHIHLKIKLR